MVLDDLIKGAQRQLNDFSLDKGTKKLIFILCLPLVDGVFPTLLVTGAVETFSDFVAVSLTIFAGAGALAVLFSYSETREDARNMVLKAAPILLLGVLAVALVAPVFREIFYVERLRYATGLALLVIAGYLSEVEIAEKFSVPAILLTGMVLSVKNPDALYLSFDYVVPALLTGLISISGLYVASYLVKKDLKLLYIRRGGAFVLFTIGLSQFGFSIPSELGLMVFAASVFASVNATG